MEKFIKMICKWNKTASKPITEEDAKLAVLMNKHLLIKRFDTRKRNASRRV